MLSKGTNLQNAIKALRHGIIPFSTSNSKTIEKSTIRCTGAEGLHCLSYEQEGC